MPPKAFKPPRPSTSTTKNSSKPKQTNGRSSTGSISKPRSTTKDRPKDKPRTSTSKAPARLSGIPSMSISSEDEDEQSDPFASPQFGKAASPTSSRASQSPIEIDSQADPVEEEEERREGIPVDLLTRLLHDGFKEDGTRLSKDASKAVGKYMEVFVREALARAAFARMEIEGEGPGGDGFLEVEDLEKSGPQLLLDF